MKKMYKWIPIGGLSLIGLVVSLIVMQFDRKLTVSIAILCGLTLLVTIIKIARNKWLVVDAKALWDGEAVCSTILPTVAFVAVTLVLSMILEIVLSVAYFVIPPPENYFYKYEGIESYQDGEYATFRFGDEASLYLPAYEELGDAEAVEFVYYDGFSSETLFIPGMTEFTVKVTYDPERYATVKDAVSREGEDFGGDIWDIRLLAREKLSPGNCLYYMVTYSDDENTVEYCVTVQDDSNYTSYFDIPYFGA